MPVSSLVVERETSIRYRECRFTVDGQTKRGPNMAINPNWKAPRTSSDKGFRRIGADGKVESQMGSHVPQSQKHFSCGCQ